jgi:hypothetical protein
MTSGKSLYKDNKITSFDASDIGWTDVEVDFRFYNDNKISVCTTSFEASDTT